MFLVLLGTYDKFGKLVLSGFCDKFCKLFVDKEKNKGFLCVGKHGPKLW